MVASSSSSPHRGSSSLLLPWPSASMWSECIAAGSGEACRFPQYVTVPLHPDQGALSGLVAHDAKLAFRDVQWLVLHGSDASLPQPHDCCCRRFCTPPVAAMTSPNIQHRNTVRFQQGLNCTCANGGIVDSGYANATTLFRLVRDFIASMCIDGAPYFGDDDLMDHQPSPPRVAHSFDALLAPTSIRRGRLGARAVAPEAAMLRRANTAVAGIFIGGHVDNDGNMLCTNGSRFTPSALAHAIEQSVALIAAQSRTSSPQSKKVAPPIVVCFGLCRNGRRWADELRVGGRATLIVESPLWGAGVLGAVPPSQRKAFKELFTESIPLFMEATLSIHANPLDLWGVAKDDEARGANQVYQSSSRKRVGFLSLIPTELLQRVNSCSDALRGADAARHG